MKPYKDNIKMRVANMATYPSRENNTFQQAISSIARQVDVVNLCLNQYSEIPDWLAALSNVKAFIPNKDYKDVGKFVHKPAPDDDVIYVDDDILYPRDYFTYLKSVADRYKELSPIVGVHGLIYSDAYCGYPLSRNMFTFRTRLSKSRVVNQLGTGTIYCKGWQCPELDFMLGSEKYVDVRFANHAQANGWPLVCAAREEKWMGDLEAEQSIHEDFTKKWPLNVIREVQSIAGYSRLSLGAVAAVECS